MSSPYKVTITMDQATVQGLLQEGYSLYAFKAVKTTAKGSPLVWFQTSKFSTSTSIQWTEQYQGYTSTSEIIPNGQVVASFSVDMDLGQILQVGVGGTGEVVNGGRAEAISLHNTTTTLYTCGMSQMQNGSPNPLCAFPLHGLNLDVIAPIEKVLLSFATDQVDTGTVIEKAFGASLMIDLTGSNTRSVSYNIDAGWDWGKAAWAKQIDADENLIPLLIT